MTRRDLLQTASATIALGAPRLVRAEPARTLKFVPIIGLTLLDPTFASNPPTRSHAYLVFDTLYGLDETFRARPQMLEGHTVEGDGTIWRLTLREGLQFHDGVPVLARDAVASIRRCALRDGFCQTLMAVTDELVAQDDRTIRFRLKHHFPHLPEVLAGMSVFQPVIMPERLANGEPSRPITEMVGSGPYRFISSNFVMGERSAYERFAGYIPRPDGTPSYTSGPKRVYFDRVEWTTIDDVATSISALRRGEVDWLDAVAADHVPLITQDPLLKAEVTDIAGLVGILRFNHLHPPFNNVAIRRALLRAIDQADVMAVLAGADRRYWHDRVGLFPYGTPLCNDAGIEAMTSPRNYATVSRDLAQAGYNGERIVVLGTSGNGYIPVLSQMGADALRRVGMTVDLQLTDYATMARRILKTDAPDKGGWNIHFAIVNGAFSHTPATNEYLRGDGRNGLPGWMHSQRFEELRREWLDAGDLAAQLRVAVDAQRQLWLDVPYVPMGQWQRVTAYRAELVDVPRGFSTFYSVRRAA